MFYPFTRTQMTGTMKFPYARLVAGLLPIAVLGLLGCGSDKAPPQVDPEPTPITEARPVANAGHSLRVYAGMVAQLNGAASRAAEDLDEPLTYQWQQLSGPPLYFLESNDSSSAQLEFIAPSVSGTGIAELELTVSQGGHSDSAQVSVTVDECPNDEGVVFDRCLASGFGPFTAYESNAERGELFHYTGQGDYHLNWQLADLGGGAQGRGPVLEVTWRANDPEYQLATNGWFGIGVLEQPSRPGGSLDLSSYAEGAISFDMRVIHQDAPNNPTPFVFKMECGWPCASAELAIPGVEQAYEWQTYTYSIASLISSGLDVTQVTYPLVVQPLWRQQAQGVTVQIDNVRLSETYNRAPPADGCPKAGNMTYTLARSANPSDDERDAYQRISDAMDEAVWYYNCHTNLERSLYVTYNPGVATADGNVNGSIRFGSHASMNRVTAMHEISHVMGVGFNAFRQLVSNGLYHGEKGNAALRAISGDPNDQLRSDGTHFWPHGLNYVSEGQREQDLIDHCVVVEAIVADLSP